MITILGGDLLCALGDKTARINHLSNGTYCTVEKSMTVFGESRDYPYYQLASEQPLAELYDPVEQLIPVIEKLIQRLQLDRGKLSCCGLFLGCSANDLSLSHPMWLNVSQPDLEVLSNERVGNGLYASRLINYFSLSSLSLTCNTACTSSANAVIDASTLLNAGLIDYALVVGFEMFAPLSFEGFSSMQLLASDKVKPFDRKRQGLILGESLAALFLSRDDIQKTPWIFKGGSSRSETASVTASKADGSGIAEVIENTLTCSSLKAEDITAVKAHGTGSPMGDVAEINGMKTVFKQQPDFFSLKPYIGHTLGACGVSELLLMMECVDHGFIPETPDFREVDEQLNWSPLTSRKACSSGLFLLNYFGFGGNNTSLIIQKE